MSPWTTAVALGVAAALLAGCDFEGTDAEARAARARAAAERTSATCEEKGHEFKPVDGYVFPHIYCRRCGRTLSTAE